MKSIVRRIFVVAAILLLGAAAGIGADRLWHKWFAKESIAKAPATGEPTPSADDEELDPAAIVRTAVAVQGELVRTIEGLGAASVPSTASSVESWPTDLVVNQVLVQPGESIAKDAPLAKVSVTREVETALASAQLAVQATSKALNLAQERLERGLSTRPELLAAQSAHDEAAQRLSRLLAGSPPPDGLLRAHTPGIVGTVRAQAGSTMLAGTPFLDITSDSIVAQIGLDPADIPGLAVGQSFDVRAIDDRITSRWTGTLSLLSRAVNPTTRLIDATLTLTGDSPPRSGTPLLARAALKGASGLIVPRVALVPQADGMIVFVVKDGTAVLTPVTVTQRGSELVVVAGACKTGDRVVVSGQGQLTSGAVVRELATDAKHAQPNGDAGVEH